MTKGKHSNHQLAVLRRQIADQDALIAKMHNDSQVIDDLRRRTQALVQPAIQALVAEMSARGVQIISKADWEAVSSGAGTAVFQTDMLESCLAAVWAYQRGELLPVLKPIRLAERDIWVNSDNVPSLSS